MNVDDSTVLDILRRSMVARIATLSRNGRPNINPLYFVYPNGRIWLGTSDSTLAARNIRANPRVSILLEVERERPPHRVLRISGHARVRTNQQIVRALILRAALKYYLTPSGIVNTLAHVRQLSIMRTYHTQSVENGQPCVIEVIPEQAEFVGGETIA